MSPSVASSFAAAPASWPKDGEITPEWVRRLASSMEANTRDADATPRNLARVCPKDVMAKLFGAALELLREERALVALDPPSRGVRVNVVGDTHGQLHDFLKLLDLAGAPSETNWFVFNGDFVDRGAWGVELFALALAWKVCLPAEVTLLRGNHECEFCTEVYGYKRELLVKYGNKDGRALYRMFLKVAQELPLAARVGAKTLVLHGGLFRAPGGGGGGGGKKKPKPKKTRSSSAPSTTSRPRGKAARTRTARATPRSRPTSCGPTRAAIRAGSWGTTTAGSAASSAPTPPTRFSATTG